jgi:hypothetical protein
VGDPKNFLLEFRRSGKIIIKWVTEREVVTIGRRLKWLIIG